VRRDGEVAEKRASYRKGHCIWCGQKVAPPRRTYCSKECVHEWNLRVSQSYVRTLVKRRDGGICAGCGRDCVALHRDLEMVASRSAGEFVDQIVSLKLEKRVDQWRLWIALARCESLDREHGREADRAKNSLRLDLSRRGIYFVRTLWDADHVVSLEEGGSHQLENIQSLCWACHKTKTAEHAKRRAARRQAEK
jgi:5-methylcytosine-specific restriction protein A